MPVLYTRLRRIRVGVGYVEGKGAARGKPGGRASGGRLVVIVRMFFLYMDDHVTLLVALLRAVRAVEHRLLAALEPPVHGQPAAVLVAFAAAVALPPRLLLGAVAVLAHGGRIQMVRVEAGYVLEAALLLVPVHRRLPIQDVLGQQRPPLVVGPRRVRYYNRSSNIVYTK